MGPGMEREETLKQWNNFVDLLRGLLEESTIQHAASPINPRHPTLLSLTICRSKCSVFLVMQDRLASANQRQARKRA